MNWPETAAQNTLEQNNYLRERWCPGLGRSQNLPVEGFDKDANPK